MQHRIEALLSGGDLRSLGKSEAIINIVQKQHDFDLLFDFVYHQNEVIVMRAADVIEKISVTSPDFLSKHKKKIIELCYDAGQKELKWHLALIIPRLTLSSVELKDIWTRLKDCALDQDESRIVRVHSIQGLFELSKREINLAVELRQILEEVEKENIPSINARIKKIKKIFTY